MTDKIIAIGALGGSGTRAVAEVFIKLDLFMGDDLNKSNDNLLFTRLFKHPEWYRASSDDEKYYRLRVFEKYMSGNALDSKELHELYNAVKTNPRHKSKLSSYISKLEYLYENRKINYDWGWKEPNTQIYVSDVLNYFPKMKYIHVLRHGLDMAFSNNVQQLTNWGWKYNIHLTGDETETQLAFKQLDFWIESTKDVIQKIRHYENRVYILNHTNFCPHPVKEIDKLLNFCDFMPNRQLLNDLYEIPKNTGSNKRYQKYSLKIFNDKQLEFVEQMGFKINNTANIG